MSKKTKIVLTIIALCLGLIFIGTKVYATSGKAINDTTRIRKKANTSSEVVAVMTKGEKIEVMSEEDGWYKVKYKEADKTIIGYVRSDLLDVEGEKSEEIKLEEKTEQTEEKTEEQHKIEEANTDIETISDEVEENEEVVDENPIVENAEIQLTADMEIQLLPVIYSCKIGKISANTKVTVAEVIGNWMRIESDNQEGWILTSKIQNNQTTTNTEETKKDENKEQNKQETETETKKMYVNTVTLNLREKADIDSKIVTQLNQNDEVIILKVIDSTWTQVKAGGYEGYTASKYLSEKKVANKTSRNSQEVRNSEEAKKKAEAEAQKKAEEEAKKKAEAEAQKKAEEEAKKKAEAEAKKKAEEEAKKKAEAEAEAKKKAEEEAKKKAEAEAEAKKKAEEEAKKKAEAEAKKKVEAESKNKTEEEKKKTAEVEAKKTDTSSKTSSSKSKTTGEDIVAYAKKFLGCKYVYGTAGPNTFDCSGLTSYVYKHFGYSLNRTSSGQRSNGKKVSKSELQPGDILCFSGHVGIYIGGNKFIHAANPRKGVIITSLSESYYVKTYITARRIL